MPEPSTGSISLAVAAVRNIFSAYGSYQKGRLSLTDKGLRDEIRRRLGMVRNHLTSTHERVLENRWVKAVSRTEAAISTVDSFHSDTTMGISGTSDSNHLDAKKPNKKELRALIEHDMSTLQRLVDATHKVNEAMAGISDDDDGESTKKLIDEVQQKVTGARNHFSERQALLGSIGG